MSEKSEINKNLERLWDLETVGINEKEQVHEELIDNITFAGEKYSVQLRWKEGIEMADRNYHNAMSRLRSLVRRLSQDPDLILEYDKIIKCQERRSKRKR